MAAPQWKELYRLFDPKARLEPADQALFVRRPGSVADSVIADLREEPEGKWVVCGSMGSGKSSELAHLAARLQGSRVVIGLDLPRSVARVDLIKPAEVLFLIGAAGLTLLDGWGHAVDPRVLNQLLSAFNGLLDRGHALNVGEMIQGVALFAASVVAPGVVAATGAAGGLARLLTGTLGDRAQVRRAPQMVGLTRAVQEGEADLERLREAVDAVLSLCANADAPPVVLVDGLDKISERGAIQSMFAASRILSMPRAQVVYTAPITLMLSTDWQATGGTFKRERLTNVAVRRPPFNWVTISDEKLGAGRDALREVVARRLALLNLGPEEVFAGDALQRLLLSSGGLLRDLIHLVNRAISRARRADAERISEEMAGEAVEEIRKEYEITLNTRRTDELRHVRKQGEPSGAPDVSAELLLTGYVLPYSNGRVWFEPHPILEGLRPGL